MMHNPEIAPLTSDLIIMLTLSSWCLRMTFRHLIENSRPKLRYWFPDTILIN